MINSPALRIVAAVIVVGGLAIAPLLDDSDSTEARLIDPLPVETPQFQILRRRGDLALTGHTASQKQEQDLLQVANSSYPGILVVTDFQPLGVVPDFWADITVQALYLLAETRFAEATVSTDKLSIRGVIDDEIGWQSRLEAIKKALPAEFTVTSDTMLVDDSVSVAMICERAFAAFKPGRINFEESSANFLGSAYPRLDRLVALANACKNSRITITGHTDASGNEVWNQGLSLKRANAVADYIVNSGIDRSRLDVGGVGSTVPIADDSTRYGRSLNRRIEIVLVSKN
ncbi:MAG: OmpA family protein [Woeseiaceae bacterium]|nr:OmpA family protein [Woeseiaceae bacterium]